MKLKDIKKQLLKEKNPIKYLEKLLKKTKDKKLIKKIKKLIEKLKTLEKHKIERVTKDNLEGLIRHAPRIPIEEAPEPEKIQRPRTTTRAITIPSMVLEVPEKKGEDYGIKIGKADYDVSTEKVKKSLQESHLIAEYGFTSGAETKHLIDQKMGDYHLSEHKKYEEEQPEDIKFEHIQENIIGLTALEKKIKKGKKEKFLPDYK